MLIYAFLVHVFLQLSAPTDSAHFYVETEKSIYVAGETVRFAVWNVNMNSQPEETLKEGYADLVAPDGKIIRQTKLDAGFSSDQFVLPALLKTGFYRIVAGESAKIPAVKIIRVMSASKPEGVNPTSDGVEKISLFPMGGSFPSGIQTEMVVLTQTRTGAGVPATCTVLNDRDSLLTYIQTDRNGIGVFTVPASQRGVLVKAQGAQTALNRSKAIGFGILVSKKQGKFQLRLFKNVQADSISSFTVRVLQRNIEKEYSFQKSDSVEISTTELKGGFFWVIVDSSGVEKQRFHLFNDPVSPLVEIDPKSTNVSDSVNWEVGVPKGFTPVIVQIYDRMQPGVAQTSFYDEYFLNQRFPTLYPVSGRSAEYYLAAGLYKEPNLNLYKRTIPENDKRCGSGALVPISVLDIHTLQAVDADCSGEVDLSGISGSISYPSAKVLAFSFSKDDKPIQPLLKKKADSFVYPALRHVPEYDTEMQLYMELYRKKTVIERAFAGEQTVQSKLAPPVFVYKMEDYAFPATMSAVFSQIVHYASVSYSLTDKRSHIRLYPFAKSYKYLSAPLFLIDDVPTLNEQAVLRLDLRYVARIEIRNTWESIRQFGRFGKNGVVSIYLKENVENPLREEIQNLPEVRGTKKAKDVSTSTTLDINPFPVWERRDAEIQSLIKTKKPLLKNKWFLQLRGVPADFSVED